MKKIEIRNITKKNIIASNGYLADNFFSRLIGLIGKKEIEINEALVIKPCRSIHTFFMSFNIDVIFVNTNGGVCKIVEDMKPNRVSKYISKARYAIELYGGSVQRIGIELGDKIEIKAK